MTNQATPSAPAVLDSGHFKGTARYEVLGCLGRGGMGIVYEVFDRQRRERVALKTLLHFDAAGLYRFKQEFRTLADVVHPNLVHLHELMPGERDEVFFTMELVQGSDFLGYVQRPGAPRAAPKSRVVSNAPGAREDGDGIADGSPDAHRLPSPADFEKLRPALRQLVEGVRALHATGKLHRDIKPSNVRVTAEGRVVVLDFGVATEIRGRAKANDAEDEIVGTVTYMAPEQAFGDAPGAASDWYSVGVLLYEAMVGRPPFVGSAVEVLTLKSTASPPAPEACVQGVPDDLNALCMALLDPDAESRPGAAEILRRLGAATPSGQAPAARVDEGPEKKHLVGRETQLGALRDALEASGQGRAIAVRVSGLSGLGKSAVAHHFLDEIERSGHVVLRGRAYERESMPYKAVDSVVDALSRLLLSEGEAIALPGDIWALAHVFPVLRRVRSVDELSGSSVGDPQVVRQRAFGALRELLASIAKRKRVVIFIDDVQWGDNDSAALLVELMRPPSAPPLMLLTTHRAEETDTSPFLADLRARWPEETEVREVTVGPLEFEDARRLALALIGSDDSSARQTADGIAREAGGSPFLVEELARGASAFHRVAMGEALAVPAALTLEQMLGARVARLPGDARRFLEMVAVGGRPLPISTLGDATSTTDSAPQLVALLSARRFVRAALRGGQEVVEATHDRIRATIVAQLPAEVAREHHLRLARVLEATPDSDPEAIASHLLGAGDKERAAHYAERAAEQAVAKLAFAQGARLFQLTLDTLGRASPEAPRLARRTAEASEWAGHPEKAARAYLLAAESAPGLERLALERAAAAQLMAAGRIDEGGEVCRRVLVAVGRGVPGSVLATLFWVIVYRIATAIVTRRPLAEAELAEDTKVRLDALHAMQRVLSVVDPISAMYVKARYLHDALRAGSRLHVVRAAAAEASTLASAGKAESKRERELFEMAKTLAKQAGDEEGYGLYLITYGISQYLRGRWSASTAILDPACAKLAAVRRWNANASVYGVYALVNLGNLREVKARTLRLLADSEQRGDYYTSVNLRASHPMAAWLASDDVEGARRHLRESMAIWSKTRFLVQNWQAMLWETEIELYAADGAAAWERLECDARRLKRSHMLSVQLIRVFTHFACGRAAIASLESLSAGDRESRVQRARRAQRDLAKEGLPWCDALAAMLAASVANATGDRPAAEQALEAAIEIAERAQMRVHADAARLHLGNLRGGDAGIALAREGGEAMRTAGVRVPERYARMLLPGPWV